MGADPLMGDGAGMLAQIPHKFFKKVVDFDLPAPDEYAVAVLFFPQDAELRAKCAALFEKALESEGLSLIGKRSVPFDNSCLSQTVIDTQPVIEQVFIRMPSGLDTTTFERKLLITRKVISNTIYDELPRGAVRLRLLCRVDVGPHHRLQGHVPGLPARRFLYRSQRP